jgi:hypothetical protein
MITDDRRVALVAARTVNGLDFVEVDPSDESKLVAHFVFNLPGSPAAVSPVPAGPTLTLSRDNFTVTGGERITDIRVLNAQARPGTFDQIDLTVAPVGDFSLYTLNLIDETTPTGVPGGFDPASASADFVFHIECAKDFDCAAGPICPPDVVAPPPINYLNKDYPGFVRVMLDRLSLLAPDWQERNPADLGVAIVEMLAYVGDQLSYRQDVIATEAYLGTARLRTSVRRHARLVDYHIGEGANARAWLRVLLRADSAGLPAGTRCATAFPGATPPLLARESRAYQQAIDAGAVFFETVVASGPLFTAHREMPLYAWSDSRSCLAPGATHATLAGAYPQLAAGMVLVLAEAKGPLSADPADADPTRRQAVRLTRALVTDDPLNSDPITEIDWQPEDALAFPLCVSSVTDSAHGQQPIIDVSVAWGNVVLADQGRTVGGPTDPVSTGPEPIGVVPIAGPRRFRPVLGQAPLTFVAPPPDPAEAASAAMTSTGLPVPAVTLTSVDLDGNPTSWSVTADLLDAGIGPSTPVFVPEIEADGAAYLLFGDGINGKRPEPGSLFSAVYRVGNGTSGNVARDAISLIDGGGLPAGVAGVTNPLPASGGLDPESVDHVRQSAPVAFRAQERAVTAADYQTLAMRYPGVQRAAATLRWTGSWHTVFLTVERTRQARLDTNFITGLKAYLDGYRMAGVDLDVEDGIRVSLLLKMEVCVRPDYVAADVRQALLSIFNADVQPDGSPGWFSPARLDLGQPIFLSPLVAAAQAVDGVTSVRIPRFARLDQPGTGGPVASVLVPGRLEFFVLDNDPNFPDRGRFELTVDGGL